MIIKILFVTYKISILKLSFIKIFMMGNTIYKTKRSRDALTSTSKKAEKIISEEDIRNRAYEIFRENDYPSSNELDNWYYAERELNGYYK